MGDGSKTEQNNFDGWLRHEKSSDQWNDITGDQKVHELEIKILGALELSVDQFTDRRLLIERLIVFLHGQIL